MKALHSDKLMITNIQRMCFHDGPGIRTTVFTKGCTLHCPWCSNPENIKCFPEPYTLNDREGVYGRDYSSAELIKILLKDKDYWAGGGGVTFSGGEPLLQLEAMQKILQQLKTLSVHVAVETALFVPKESLQYLWSDIDYFIVDIKILDVLTCHKVLGGDLDLYQNNVKWLYKHGKLKLFRIPCCPEYTFTKENKKQIRRFLRQFLNIPVQIFSVHHLGEQKYHSLRYPMFKSAGVADKELRAYCIELEKDGIRAEVNNW